MLVSKMIADAQGKQVAAEKEQYVQEHKTDVQRVFTEVAGKELTREKIDEIVRKYNGRVAIDYYEQAASIHPADDFSESIKMSLISGTESYGGFVYNGRVGYDNIFIYKRENGYEYYHKGSQMFDSFDGAFGAYLLEKKEEQNK
jgi:hypothetical protein